MRHPHTLHNGDVDWSRTRLLAYSHDDAFRFLLRSTFRKLGIRDVRSTATASDAAEQMAVGPDLVLVDFRGEAMAGALDFLGRVRAGEVGGDVPVLAVLRAGQKEGLAEACALGIEGTLPMPVSGHELTLRVAATLKGATRMPAPEQARTRPKIPLVPPSAIIREQPAPAAAAQAPPLAPPPPPPSPSPSPAAASPVPGSRTAMSGGGAADAAARAPRPSGPIETPRPSGPIETPRPSGPIETPKSSGPVETGPIETARPSGSIETARPRPSAGRLEEGDLAVRPRQLDDAARDRAERERAAWKEALAVSGHKPRKGGDVGGLDVSAIVAEHTLWLATKGTQGRRANFEGMDLGGIDLSRAVLANAGFRRTQLADACLAESRLDGADMRHASLSAADLSGANLGVAQLRHADLRLANLEGAILRGADMSGARLAGARLAGADFKGATLLSADLCGADLSQAENLSQAQIDKTACDMKTRLPPGLRRPAREDE